MPWITIRLEIFKNLIPIFAPEIIGYQLEAKTSLYRGWPALLYWRDQLRQDANGQLVKGSNPKLAEIFLLKSL